MIATQWKTLRWRQNGNSSQAFASYFCHAFSGACKVYDSVEITVTHDCPSQLCTVGDGSRAKPAVIAATKEHVKKYSLNSELNHSTLKMFESSGWRRKTLPPSGRKHTLQSTDELCLGLQMNHFGACIIWVWVLTSTQPCNLMQVGEYNTITGFRWWRIIHFWKWWSVWETEEMLKLIERMSNYIYTLVFTLIYWIVAIENG